MPPQVVLVAVKRASAPVPGREALVVPPSLSAQQTFHVLYGAHPADSSSASSGREIQSAILASHLPASL